MTLSPHASTQWAMAHIPNRHEERGFRALLSRAELLEGHGRESRSLSYISADEGSASTEYCPKPRKTRAHSGRVIWLCDGSSVTSVNTNTQNNHFKWHLQAQ